MIAQIIAIFFENAIKYNDAISPEIELIFEESEKNISIHIRDNGSDPGSDFINNKMKGEKNLNTLGLYTATLLAQKNGYMVIYNDTPIKEFILEIPKVAA